MVLEGSRTETDAPRKVRMSYFDLVSLCQIAIGFAQL